MECSRDSCHHMRYIDCSSAMILGTSRLLSAPDPPWTGRWIKGVLSSRPRRLFLRHTYVHIFHDFSLIQLRSTLCVVYLCPRVLLKRRRGFLRRNIKEEFLSNEEIKRKQKDRRIRKRKFFLFQEKHFFCRDKYIFRVRVRFRRWRTNHLLSGSLENQHWDKQKYFRTRKYK